ncbi:MAG: hypothetical protein ACFFAJ_08105 [Candidatus Hodarchaeota archaeon]
MPSTSELYLQGKANSKQWKAQYREQQALKRIFTEQFDILHEAPKSYVKTGMYNDLVIKIGERGAAEDKVPPLLVSGPQGCGKTTALRKFAYDINEDPNIHDSVLYKACDEYFLSWWDEADFRSIDVFIFDNIFPFWEEFTNHSYQDLLNRSGKKKIFVVGVLNSIERHQLQINQKLSQTPFFGQKDGVEEFRFDRSSSTEIIKMIKSRLNKTGKPYYFSQNILNTISTLSLGSPRLAFWLVSELIRVHKDTSQEITIPFVHLVADYLGFGSAIKLIEGYNFPIPFLGEALPNTLWPLLKPLQQTSDKELSPLLQSLTKIKQVSKSWIPLLEELLLLGHQNNSIKRSDLQEHTGVKDSSLTYQCQRLIQEKIISYSKEGREVYYQLRSPVKEALELTFFG